MAKITADTQIGELLQMDTGFIPILMEEGMHCVGCPSSQMESIGEACMVHGMSSEGLLKKLNDYLENK